MDAPPVQYVKTSDGYDIAYSVRGTGRPLLFLPPPFISVQAVWHHFAEWMKGLTQRFRLVVFDRRGSGLSTRGLPGDMAITDYIQDMAAIAELFKDERLLLYAVGAKGHDAIRFAAANPARVEAMIWNVANIRNAAWPSGLWVTLPQESWKVFLASLAPREQSLEEQRRRIADYDSAVTREDWNTMAKVISPSNIEAELRRLKIPLLVMHPRDFIDLPIEESMKVAALVPNTRLAILDGAHVWGGADQGLAAIDAFLASLPLPDKLSTPAAPHQVPDDLSTRELEVLRLLAQGKSNPEIADELFISLNTVQNHLKNIYRKANLTNRAQAAVYAQHHGLV